MTLQTHQTSELSQNRKRGGFSATELLVVVAMLAVLASVSLPIFAATLQSSRFNGAVLQLASEIRSARSLAVSKGGFYGIHSGRDPLIVDAALINSFRIEYSANGATWPAVTASTGSDPAVITDWQSLSKQFTGVTVQSVVDGSATPIGGPIFNSIGGSVDLANAIRPVVITLADDSGATKVIQVNPPGNVKLP
ncbi:MAG: pilus assembly FimT family protein [Candidatus Methylomirabilis sp.]